MISLYFSRLSHTRIFTSQGLSVPSSWAPHDAPEPHPRQQATASRRRALRRRAALPMLPRRLRRITRGHRRRVAPPTEFRLKSAVHLIDAWQACAPRRIAGRRGARGGGASAGGVALRRRALLGAPEVCREASHVLVGAREMTRCALQVLEREIEPLKKMDL